MSGCFSLVLHTHMPYVRRNGIWPVGEDWLYQVMADTYLPLLGMLAQLEHEGISHCLALTLTPVLCEQLADPYVKERFGEYLKTMSEHTSSDINDFVYFDDEERKALAEVYLDEYRRKRLAFRVIDGDLLGAIRSFESSGMIETIASCATHAFLPGLSERAAERQVVLGIESHRRHLGRDPAGFWLPECAYRDGIEKVLEREGIAYTMVDPSAVPDVETHCPVLIANGSVAALARSDRAHDNVWDEAAGYPTDPRYLDSTKYYEGSGLLYWKVTGRGVDIEDKAVYEPHDARVRALDHSTHFLAEVCAELEAASGCAGGVKPLVTASYDTELFGHGWREGLYWMEITLRSLTGSAGIEPVTPSLYLEKNRPALSAALKQTTWGTDRDDSTWLNPDTEWMWRELSGAERRFDRLASGATPSSDPPRLRGMRQLLRELLLLESSDWPYMVAKDRASQYAVQRFNTHLERFSNISETLESGALDREMTFLSEVEEADRIFAELDLGFVWRGAPAEDEEGDGA